MKLFSVVLIALALASCGLMPDKFDAAEYSALVRVAVIAENAKDCDSFDINTAWINSAFLEKYAENTMNENTHKIYAELNDLVTELKNRENPSVGYCVVKWRNISYVSEKALSMSGSRMK